MQNNKKNQVIENQGFYSKMEEDVLNFWKQADIFRKSIMKDAPMGNYVFNDGPPFITGLPHYATLLPSIAKDVVPRYWTMKGYRVERVWGWDCHGLPAENKVEKQLGLNNKKDIEELGVEKFVDACRTYVNQGTEQWEWYINRIGRWVDMKNAYKTMDLQFMESVLWSFKELYDLGLIYEGYRTSLHCPRCATPLSKFEVTMDSGSYRDVVDKSIVVKFKVRDLNCKENLGVNTNTYLLAWTTTPWTLPGNLALAVGRDIDYSILELKKIKRDSIVNELGAIKYIIASNKVGDFLKETDYLVINTIQIKGRELIGLSYEPIYNLNNDEIKKSEQVYKVYDADFVNTEDGTGIVHIAPNFGEDDFKLGESIQLPIIDLMDENGIYLDSVGKWSGYYFKKANRDILIDLTEREEILVSLDFTHTYPFCYRCETPLIYKTQKAWYLDIQKIKQRMLETNVQINWVPEHFKYGRFQNNIENAPDWCLSRSRYWGSPIPVWKCKDCNKIKVLGSIEEIEKLSGKKVDDLHRPNIDQHFFKCDCGGVMERIKEVFDCWFESGAMPFAQFHYPFERKEDFLKMFPADFIIEYTGQLRGWFYYLHVLSNALFHSISFKNVVVSGVLAGTDGRKMSKSFGNYPDPRSTLEKYGSDALRMYFMSSSIMLGDDTSLSEIDIQDSLRKNVIILWNVVKFYTLFQPIDEQFDISEIKIDVIDKWVLIKLNLLIDGVTKNLEAYNLPGATRLITLFIDDLSTWYLRRSRDRFKAENENDKQVALTVMKLVLTKLSMLMAPFAPFISEQIWQKVAGHHFKNQDKSVHLEKWPDIIDLGELNNEYILQDMQHVRNVIELGLAKRAELGIKIRQPLQSLKVKNFKVKQEFEKLLLDELNVKDIFYETSSGDISVEFDTNLTLELKSEGIKREIVRFINAKRKDLGFYRQDCTKIFYHTDSELILDAIKFFSKGILRDTLSNEIIYTENILDWQEVKIDGDIFRFYIKKISDE